MSKSKLPDLKELTSMTGKLLKDLKHSVKEIVSDYKEKRQTDDDITEENSTKTPNPDVKPVKPSESDIQTSVDTKKEPDAASANSEPEAGATTTPEKEKPIKKAAKEPESDIPTTVDVEDKTKTTNNKKTE